MLLNDIQYWVESKAARFFPRQKYVSSRGTTLDGREYFIRLEREDRSGKFDHKKEKLTIDTIAAVVSPKCGRSLFENHAKEES